MIVDKIMQAVQRLVCIQNLKKSQLHKTHYITVKSYEEAQLQQR